MAANLDLVSYGQLLAETHPQNPQTAEENDRLIKIINDLHRKPALSREEEQLVEMLVVLVENFEESHYATKRAEPHAILRELMRSHGLQPKDLYAIFGSKGTTSEVLRGKRGISKSAARKLAEQFGVSIDLFIC